MEVPKTPDDGPQAELLELIEILEDAFRRLRDVDAQVSDDGLRRLREARGKLTRVTRSNSRAVALDVAKAILAELAVEAIRWLMSGTSTYLFPAFHERCRHNDSWRRSSNTANVGGLEANGLGYQRRRFRILDFAGRVRAA